MLWAELMREDRSRDPCEEMASNCPLYDEDRFTVLAGCISAMPEV